MFSINNEEYIIKLTVTLLTVILKRCAIKKKLPIIRRCCLGLIFSATPLLRTFPKTFCRHYHIFPEWRQLWRWLSDLTFPPFHTLVSFRSNWNVYIFHYQHGFLRSRLFNIIVVAYFYQMIYLELLRWRRNSKWFAIRPWFVACKD